METLGSQLSRYGAIASQINVAPSAKAFFVLNTSNSNFGALSTEFPVDRDGVTRVYGTIDAAIGACVAGRGDVIFVMPGHTESITAAAGIVCDVSGVRIQGLGEGSNRPTITWSTATTADWDIDAANVTIDNFVLDMTGIDAVAAAIDVNATDFTLSNCYVTTATASAQCTVPFLADANASRFKVIGNHFIGSTNAGTTCAIQWVGGSEQQIRNNVFIGAYTTTLGALNNLSSTSARMTIDRNYIINSTASSTTAMVFVSTSTGIISNNRMQILSGTAPITGAAMSWAGGNYYAATIATAGVLI